MGIAGRRCCESACCMDEDVSRRRYRQLSVGAGGAGGLQRGARFLLMGRKAEILDSLRNIVSV